MVSHAEFLRDQSPGQEQHVAAFVRRTREVSLGFEEQLPREQLASVLELVDDLAGFDDEDKAILRYVGRVTVWPRSTDRSTVQAVREAGLTEVAIHDVAAVAACFAYMNAWADALGVTLTGNRIPYARALFGDDVVDAHLAWGNSD